MTSWLRQSRWILPPISVDEAAPGWCRTSLAAPPTTNVPRPSRFCSTPSSWRRNAAACTFIVARSSGKPSDRLTVSVNREFPSSWNFYLRATRLIIPQILNTWCLIKRIGNDSNHRMKLVSNFFRIQIGWIELLAASGLIHIL